jgi:hypothetical protein
MASWTDKIPTFNPYVQQLPVEAMVEVGMQKQKQYNEGIQKIQTNIDNIAGLDLVRDIDKSYLQSKLNQLGNDTKYLAAADFSDFQMVNSVTGMANQIGKDATVQSAVGNTAKYRREMALAEKFRKEGKSSANREYDLSVAANSWMDNPDLNAGFSGKAKQYHDVDKKVLEVIGKLSPKIDIKDIPYNVIKNKDGSINYNGISAAMQKITSSEISPEQIRTAVNSMLDSNDLDELASQGRYNYRGYGVEELQSSATAGYESSKLQYKGNLERLKQQLLTTTDLGQQEEINKSINFYTKQLGDGTTPGELQSSYEQLVSSISDNPDGARSMLYKKNWLDQIANGFQHRDVKDEIVENPLRKDWWEGKKFEFDQIKEANNQAYRKRTLEQGDRALDIKAIEAQTKADKDKGTYDPFFQNSGNPSTSNLESMNNYLNYNSQLASTNDQILSSLANGASSLTTKVSPDIIKTNIDKYRIGKYAPKTLDEKRMFDQYIQNQNTLDTQAAMLAEIEDQEYRKLTGDKKGYEQATSQLLSKNGNFSVYSAGTKYTFTPKEVYNYLKKEKSKTVGSSGSSMTPMSNMSQTTFTYVDDASLTKREKLLKAAFAKRYNSANTSTGNAASDQYISGIKTIINRNKPVETAVATKVADRLSTITGGFKTEQSALKFKDTNWKANFASDMANIASADMREGTAGKEYNPEKTLGWLTKDEIGNIDFQFKREGTQYYVHVTNKSKKGETQVIPVTEDFVRKNQSLGENYLTPNPDLGEVTLRNNKTTNILKDFQHAHLPTSKFGGMNSVGNRTVTLPVGADYNVGNDGKLYAVIKLLTNTGNWLEFNVPYAIDKNEFENVYLPSMNDAKIIALFKTKNENIEQLISR